MQLSKTIILEAFLQNTAFAVLIKKFAAITKKLSALFENVN